jgi:hypothetical protein
MANMGEDGEENGQDEAVTGQLPNPETTTREDLPKKGSLQATIRGYLEELEGLR